MKSYAHRGGVQDMWCRRGIQEVRLLGIKELMSGWHCQCLPELLNHFYWAVFCFSNRQFLQILRKKQPLKTLRWLVQAELCSSFFQSRPGKNQEKSLQRASQWKVTEVTWCHTGSISHDFCTHEMNWTRGTSPLATWNSHDCSSSSGSRGMPHTHCSTGTRGNYSSKTTWGLKVYTRHPPANSISTLEVQQWDNPLAEVRQPLQPASLAKLQLLWQLWEIFTWLFSKCSQF